MRKSLLAASGIAAMLLLLVGIVMVSGLLSPDRALDPTKVAVSAGPQAPTPADRYSSRGILPLETDPELGAIEVYLVNADHTLHPPPHGLRQEIWDLAMRILGPATSMIDSYKVAHDADSERTAWVVEHRTRDGDWILGINLATSTDPTQLAATLVHEFGHLISLRDGQVVEPGDGCTTVLLPEGCAMPGGYLDSFHSAFWARYGADAPDPANADADAARAFYRADPDAFVSEYAATNLAEDFAESFAAYVHADADPSGQLVAGKLAFFDRFEEMAAIRERIRLDLGDTLGTLRLEMPSRTVAAQLRG